MRSSTRVWMVLGALVGLLATGPAAAAAPGDLGTEDFSYAPLTGSPTQTKPESKLWFADGSWWGDLYSPSAGVHRIHRFDAGADRWVDTGTTLDNRPNANADILWHAASRKLYVASHVFTQVSAPAPPSQSGRVYRYSYDPATRSYSLDPRLPSRHQRCEDRGAGHGHGLHRPALGHVAARRRDLRHPHGRG
jgi:hypothetical protein